LRLIDIHSQHQNLELGNRSFQLKLVDLVAGNEPILKKYTRVYEELLDRRAQLASLKAEAERAKADLDYYEFQFKQLDEARLKENEQKELETEQAELEHSGEIKTTFGLLSEEIENEEYGILLKLKGQTAQLSKLAGISPQARQMKERLESCYFELKDLAEESASLSERAEHNRIGWHLFRADWIRFIRCSRVSCWYSARIDRIKGRTCSKDPSNCFI
jgi:DNA repair protein RecN (Recombination protein N)